MAASSKESRIAYTVRLPAEVLEQAKDAAAHYRMSVTDFFTLAITTTHGQLEDRDGAIPSRLAERQVDVEALSEALRLRARRIRAHCLVGNSSIERVSGVFPDRGSANGASARLSPSFFL